MRAGLAQIPASHQCYPGSIVRVGVTFGLSFVSSLLSSERFFSGYFGLVLSSKTNVLFDT